MRLIENVLLGGTIVFWAVVNGLRFPFSPVLTAATTLNVCVGVLIAVRSTDAREGSWRSASMALPSVLLGVAASHLASPPDSWPVLAETTFIVGAILACVSFLVLGRSFAVLPAVRGIVTSGPYRLVRHPAYVGELLMAGACLLADPSAFLAAVLLAGLVLTLLRIRVEEQLLRSVPAYAEYARQVRHRLVPGVW